MKKASKSRRPAAKPLPERRQKRVLREVIDELIDHVREVSRNAKDKGPSDLEYAHERLQWLADEIWRLALEGDDDSLQ
jgi:uncharacterized protein (UPF0305 family)